MNLQKHIFSVQCKDCPVLQGNSFVIYFDFCKASGPELCKLFSAGALFNFMFYMVIAAQSVLKQYLLKSQLCCIRDIPDW